MAVIVGPFKTGRNLGYYKPRVSSSVSRLSWSERVCVVCVVVWLKKDDDSIHDDADFHPKI